jgi:hypothetical protein
MLYLFSKFGILNETMGFVLFFYTHDSDHYGIIDKVMYLEKLARSLELKL